MHIVEPRIPAPGERDHLGAQRCCEAIVCRSFSTPMGEPRGSGLPERPAQPPDLPRGDLQCFDRLGRRDLPPLEQGEYVQAASFLWGQWHLSSSSWVRERTEWLNN